MTKECVKESINGIDALLTGCREIRAECAEGVGAIFGSESARDFLFHFNHADIAFGLIVIKGNAEIGHKGQNAGFVSLKAVKQVFRW